MELLKLIMPALVIYILLRRKNNLGVAMVGGALVLGLLYAIKPKNLIIIGWQGLFSSGSLTLFGSLYMIMFLEHILRVNGVLDRLMNASRLLISDARIVMAMLPAFLGFLPSLGGALFSAPLVSKAAEGTSLSGERKCLINYWYRHVWEYFLPIYPSLLLVQEILKIPMREIITNGFIYTILAFIIGMFVCFRGVPRTTYVQKEINETVTALHYRDMALALGPIGIILLLVVFLQMSVILATTGVLVFFMVWFSYNLKGFLLGLKEAFHLKTFSAVAGVLIFKEMLMQSGALPEIVGSINSLAVPPVIMIGIMGFVVSWVTGMPQAAVGIAFPLISVIDPGHAAMGSVVMVCIIAGQMISPMHLCLVVTREYFECCLGDTLLKVLKGEILMIIAAFTIYFLMS